MSEEITKLIEENKRLACQIQILEKKNLELCNDLEKVTQERDLWHRLHDAAALGWA